MRRPDVLQKIILQIHEKRMDFKCYDFFRADYIEQAGTGIGRIKEADRLIL